MSAFEIQSFSGGQWTIETVANDRDSAIFEAQRLLQGKRIRSVRVVQEIYDAASDSYRMKVIFRREREAGGMVGNASEKQEAALARRGGKAPGEEEDGRGFFTRFFQGINQSLSAFVSSVAFIIIKFTIIVGLGIWLLLILNDLAKKL